MLNLKSFEDYVHLVLESTPNICERLSVENDTLEQTVFDQISNLTGKNCVVVNDVFFAASLAKKGNEVYCLYFDKDVELPFASTVHYTFIDKVTVTKSTKNKISADFSKKVLDSFNKYKTSKSIGDNVPYGNDRCVDVIFNFSIPSEASFDFQYVTNVNLFIFNTFFTPGITTWYSFDEDKVMMEFTKKSSDKYGFKLKVNKVGKKIDNDTWNNVYGFKDNTERYLTRFEISEDELFNITKYNGNDLEDKDINGRVEFGSNLITGVIEPRIYAFRTDSVDNVLPEDNTALKVGDTNRDIMQRMNEWEKVFPDLKRLGDWSAVLSGCGDGIDGKIFRDYTVHKILEKNGKRRLAHEDFGAENILAGRYSREFFENCTPKDVEDAIEEIKKLAKENRYDILSRLKNNTGKSENRFIYPTHSHIKKMATRELQEKTIKRFEDRFTETKSMLMYAVMRFGKTYTACRCMDKWKGNFNVVVSGKVGVKNEWIGTINKSSQFFEYDAYDASDKTGGIKWMLECDKERIEIGKDDKGNPVTIRGPHPGQKFNTLQEYFDSGANIQKWWVVKGNDQFNDAYFETEEEAIENSDGREVEEREIKKKIVIFVSLQDLMGDMKGKKVKDKIEYIKNKHKCFYDYPIDILIIDEAHFATESEVLGATINGERTPGESVENPEEGEVMNPEDTPEVKKYDYKTKANPEDVDLDDNDDITDKEQRETSYALGQTINITPDTKKLYLSGTPYDLMADEKFVDEDIIARFGFKDLMQAKKEWDDAAEKPSKEWVKENDAKKDAWFNMSDVERKKWIESHPDEKPFEDDNSNPYRKEKNPYFGIPKMITMGYKMDKMRLDKFCDKGVFKFKLFLETEKINGGKGRRFINEKQVLKLFRIIDGAEHDGDLMTILDVPAFKKGDMLKNIVIVLPYRRCCDAFEQMMLDYRDKKDENGRPMFKHLGDYVIIKATSEIDKSIDPDFAKDEVLRNVERGNNTITLTVGRLMTGVTVKPWDTMFYMRDLNKAQEYDQAKFRIQTPYVKEVSTLDVDDVTGKLEKTKEPTLIDMKPQTLFVDFSPRRMFDLTKRRIFAHSGACGGMQENTDGRGVYGLIEDEIEAEKDFLPVALMENGSIRECTSLDVANYIKGLQKNVKINTRMASLKKWPKASPLAMALLSKVKPNEVSNKEREKVDAILGETDLTSDELKAIQEAVDKGKEIPKEIEKAIRKRISYKCSKSDLEKLQNVFVNRVETIMKDIFMFIILKNDNTDIPDFQRLWDAMTHVGDDETRNYKLVYNIFFEDLGLEDKGSLKLNVLAIKKALQTFIKVYLKPNQKIEEFVEMMYQTQQEFREDLDAYTNLKEELKTFSRLDKSEIITPDNIIKDLCKDFVIFKDEENKVKILDCYCSKIGEVPYYLSTDPKFKDDFDIDNYYMICRTGLIAELNRPVIQMLYAKKYPQTKEDEEKNGKNFSLNCIKATNKFMDTHIIITNQSIDHSEDEMEGDGSGNDISETTPTIEGTPENSSFVNLKGLEHFIKESTGDDEETNDIIKRIKKKWGNMIQFDIVIGNPPYSGNLHLKVFNSIKDVCKNTTKISWICPDIFADYMKLKSVPDGLVSLQHFSNKEAADIFGGKIQTANGLCISKYDLSSDKTLTLKDISMIENWPTDGIKYVEEVREKTKVTLKDKIEIFDNQKYFTPITIMQKVDGGSLRSDIICDIGVLTDGCIDGIHYKKLRNNGGRSKEDRDLYGFSFNTYDEAKNCFDSFKLNAYMKYVHIIHLHSRYILKDYPYLEDYTKSWTDETFIKYFNLSNESIDYIKNNIISKKSIESAFETSIDPESSSSSSETLPKSIYDLELRRLDPNPEIPEDEKYKEEDLKNAYPDKYERFEKDGEDYSFRYWLYKELDK